MGNEEITVTEKSEWEVWRKYLCSEKRSLRIFLIHIVISVVFIVLVYFGYKIIKVPEYKLKDIYEKAFNWAMQWVDSETKFEDLRNPIGVIIFGATLSGIIMAAFTFLINMFKSRYDTSFMSYTDQIKQNVFFIGLNILFFSIVIFMFLATNLFNVVHEVVPKFPVTLFFVIIAAFIFIFGVCKNVVTLNEGGRSDILSFLEAFFIVSLLISYPIKEGSLVWVIIYMVFMNIITLSLMFRLETIYRNDTAIYYFQTEEGINDEKNDEENNEENDEKKDGKKRKLFIHYRLDDERVVCSEKPSLKEDSQKILYSISDLCNIDIKKDTSSYDSDWKTAVAKIKVLRDENAKCKAETKAERKAKRREKIKAIPRNIANWFKSIWKKITIIGWLYGRLSKKRKALKEANSEIERLKAEVTDLKKQLEDKNNKPA